MFLRSALLSLSALAAAKEMPKDEVKGAKLYDTGIRHANNMALKHVSLPAPQYERTLNYDYRSIGPFRRQPVPTSHRSTPKSRTRSSASTVLPSPQRIRSGVATLTSSTSSLTQSWAARVVLAHPRGVGLLTMVVNLSPLANKTELPLPKLPRRASCLTLDACPSTPPQARGAKSVAKIIS
jgi:hypothetical protein